MRRQILQAAAALAAIALVTAIFRLMAPPNATTVALGYLLVVLFVAAAAELWTAVLASLAAMLCFNYFFLPPIGTLTIADLHNWVALIAFLIVSIVASNLSASARARASEAMDRRRELTRLFDLTRDILLTTEREGAVAAIARHVARRFELDVVAVCVPSARGDASAPRGAGPSTALGPGPSTALGTGWEVHQGGPTAAPIAGGELDRAFAAASGVVEFDAYTRSYGGHRELQSSAGALIVTPVRLGARAIALLVTGGRTLEPGARDAVAGIVAIALERSQFLDERRAAELARQRAELTSALLASLSHDLRTPLTAIRTAISNLDSPALSEGQRREQARVASGELERLTRLFEEILDMARIEAGAVQAQRIWTTPAEVVEAGIAHVATTLAGRDVQVEAIDDAEIEIDPRLTSSALAQLIENAARYAPHGPIAVKGWVDIEGLRLEVRDSGPGILPAEMERLFEPFYRGERGRQGASGTGMGLSITRGLLAAEGGRVWGENVATGGACFSIAVPARSRAAATVD